MNRKDRFEITFNIINIKNTQRDGESGHLTAMYSDD